MERHDCSEWGIGMRMCSEGTVAAVGRRRNGCFHQQEILRSCALTCWCLMRGEFFHTCLFEDSRGLSGFSEVSEGVVSTLMPFLQGTCQWICHSYLATYEHRAYGNSIPSRPRSLCQNCLKLANGLQSYFLWDWEGTDGLALERNIIACISCLLEAKLKIAALSLSYKLYMHVFYRGRFIAFNI